MAPSKCSSKGGREYLISCGRSVLAGSVDPEASRKMREAIAEELPDIVMHSVADFMLLPSTRAV